MEIQGQEIQYGQFVKPIYSYATLIYLAISSNQDKRMTLGNIYRWISETYPYYDMNTVGWQVRERERKGGRDWAIDCEREGEREGEL